MGVFRALGSPFRPYPLFHLLVPFRPFSVFHPPPRRFPTPTPCCQCLTRPTFPRTGVVWTPPSTLVTAPLPGTLPAAAVTGCPPTTTVASLVLKTPTSHQLLSTCDVQNTL